ncbi:hypothetical protein [Actinoplanes sp. HUAS TT8]|uniref:hypothetical protein n=1 Tax=Actinoplanes sp. HUAS TT8 TaxID=3447453 RepID=UPI003F51BE3C
MSSTLVADRIRWSRDRPKITYEARKQLYSEFLTELSTTRDILRAAGREYFAAEVSRQQAANEAFRVSNLYSRRYQVSNIAPPEIVAAATTSVL